MPSKKTPPPQLVERDAMQRAVKDSADHAWTVGMGAFAKAQAEGSKMLDALARDGQALQRRVQVAATEQWAEAAQHLDRVGQHMGQSLENHAAAPIGKLESLFDERVAQALQRLGYPSPAEIAALQAAVHALQQQVLALTPNPPAGAAGLQRASAATAAAPKKASKPN